MLRWFVSVFVLMLAFASCRSSAVRDFTLDYDTPVDPTLRSTARFRGSERQGRGDRCDRGGHEHGRGRARSHS